MFVHGFYSNINNPRFLLLRNFPRFSFLIFQRELSMSLLLYFCKESKRGTEWERDERQNVSYSVWGAGSLIPEAQQFDLFPPSMKKKIPQTFFYFIFINVFMYLLAALGLCCCARTFSSCGERGLLFLAVHGFLIAVASLVAEHGL